MRYFSLLITIIFLQSPIWAKSSARWVGEDFQGITCKGKGKVFGPYDYTNSEHRARHLKIVERHHFRRKHEQLKTFNALDDINYTLNAFPNHPRALAAVIKYYELKRKKNKSVASIRAWITPPECYLQKAMSFSPKDATPHALMGLYTHRLKMFKKAEKAYRMAIKLFPQSSEAHYMLGLLLTDLKRYDEALAEARVAYKLGYPLPGLKRRLEAAGYSL